LTLLENWLFSFPKATEEPHFEKTSFRVKKKFFATYDKKNKRACRQKEKWLGRMNQEKS
jgi:hypothetical protein